jgi:hypothetical protein
MSAPQSVLIASPTDLPAAPSPLRDANLAVADARARVALHDLAAPVAA